ncbi:MAG TPA: hypothetical protein DEP38_05900 [Cyanobacteria bacterium UBA9226]|nr:hypothetical protein [Cyanobacteria bacterium UBA9226]
MPIIQRQPDEEKASAREEKIAEKPRENIQAKVETTENKPVPEITNSTDTISPKIRRSNRNFTPNSSQNRPPQINRQNFPILPQTIQPKTANWDDLNLSGSNQSPNKQKSSCTATNIN